MLVYVNGRFVPKEQATVSVFDHGFLYGDGVFEGIRAYNGRVFKLDEHIQRLYESAHAIMLEIPMTPEEMAAAVVETCRRNGLSEAYIRVVVSRGPGDLGIDPRKCPRPSVVIIADRLALYPTELYEQGMKVMTVATRRVSPAALNPRVKSLNYLNNIMARLEANLAGYAEVIMLNDEGYVAECTGDNIFIVLRGRLLTPPPHLGILQGITRDTIFERARPRAPPGEAPFSTRHDLYIADECFITGTAAEVCPVVEVDGRRVGDGRPGPITRQLMEDYRAYARSHGTPIWEEQDTRAAGGQ
ncbi:MAG: branched-chain-amino-acid transaminase [Bacillota bacterium]|nr:MAG: branched-chain-amino-acid transaminase [Bacillota bacterium]